MHIAYPYAINLQMRLISRTEINSYAPGGDNYEWNDVNTSFVVTKSLWHVIKITATAFSEKQNESTDDDDLRVEINSYRLGKYASPVGDEHYKGFDTSASWNGTALKGNAKTIYFFVYLTNLGQNLLRFYADGKPYIENIEIYELDETHFHIENVTPAGTTNTDRGGIPLISFVFLGPIPKEFIISASGQSGKQKNNTDGDNIKILLNGEIIKNEASPTSDKYKNFYFSGDQLKGINKELTFTAIDFKSLENSIEILYDQSPIISNIDIKFTKDYESLKELLDESSKKNDLYLLFYSLCNILQISQLKYTSQFLRNSLNEEPENLHYTNNSNLAKKVKKDTAYEKIVEMIKKEIENGRLSGEIFPGNTKETTMKLESFDLKTSVHGIKKIEYQTKRPEGTMYSVNISLFDIYDFEPDPTYTPGGIIVSLADKAENLGILHNFEIIISTHETIKLSK